jgi:hypothetical protein
MCVWMCVCVCPLTVYAYQGPNLETFSEMTDKGGKVANYWAREFGHHAM